MAATTLFFTSPATTIVIVGIMPLTSARHTALFADLFMILALTMIVCMFMVLLHSSPPFSN